jgi:hypothetical protein
MNFLKTIQLGLTLAAIGCRFRKRSRATSRRPVPELPKPTLMAMLMNATADLFNRACFNCPTLGDLYSHAAYDVIV